ESAPAPAAPTPPAAPPAPQPVVEDLSPDAIKEIQTLLREMNLFLGRPAGKVTPSVRASVRLFNEQDGLPDDDRITPRLIQRLRQAHVETFVQAAKSESVSVLEEYLRKYPYSSYKEDAINHIFELAKKENTIEGYDRFVRHFSDSPMVREAISRTFQLYKERNTVEGYDEFLAKYPNRPETAQAIKSEFDLYSASGNADDLKEFSRKFPTSPLSRRGAEKNFQHELETGTAQSLYIAAGKMEREGDLEKAKMAYQRIIEAFPGSEFSVKASDRLLVMSDRGFGASPTAARELSGSLPAAEDAGENALPKPNQLRAQCYQAIKANPQLRNFPVIVRLNKNGDATLVVPDSIPWMQEYPAKRGESHLTTISLWQELIKQASETVRAVPGVQSVKVTQTTEDLAALRQRMSLDMNTGEGAPP
ncbi:MAG: tetratricopeptide repeat protein, partial [Magnetococcales bacterium]|nr:tetratricopeptide repeat protein [Magnetococcales bacterium]